MGTTVASPLVLLARIGRHLSESYSYESNEGGAEPRNGAQVSGQKRDASLGHRERYANVGRREAHV